MSLPSHIVTNAAHSNESVLKKIRHELQHCEEFYFFVAFITNSGVTALQQTLELMLAKDVKGKILTSDYQYFTEPEALKKLNMYSNMETRMICEKNMHSKGFFFKNKTNLNIMIGSSNWTANALQSNIELNLFLETEKVSNLAASTLTEFHDHFNNADIIDDKFLSNYKKKCEVYRSKISTIPSSITSSITPKLQPNQIQLNALKSLEELRSNGKNKALIISATGTGKTYLAAFDVKTFNPKRCLFLVHRENIARKSKESFNNVLNNEKSLGIYSGNLKEISSDYLFSTSQTMAMDRHLHKFSPDEFDYIIIDETHRAGAQSYEKIIDYFKPKFLLGMTATPERSDGYDIYKHYDNIIAYEIRLQQALESGILCPFHYFGISEINVEGELINDETTFNDLVSEQRVNHIINTANKYGTFDGITRGLIFCSRTDEAEELSKAFNNRGFKTIALSGKTSELERKNAIQMLESTTDEKIDYIFTVDIFNEGVDIPSVNQIIMLRPTQSAIIFVQQLGRGLRKPNDEKYLTVIDFIGNYQQNFFIPVALFGDTSFDKDNLRRLVMSGDSSIAGSSTVQFDEISKKQIYESINKSKLNNIRELKNDYQHLKSKIGRRPFMMDFIKNSDRDPTSFFGPSGKIGSYYDFVNSIEINETQNCELEYNLSPTETKLLKIYSNHALNGKSVEEAMILSELLSNYRPLDKDFLINSIESNFGFRPSKKRIVNAVSCINLTFYRETNTCEVVQLSGNLIILSNSFKNLLSNLTLSTFLKDLVAVCIHKFKETHKSSPYFLEGLHLNQKYTRKDVLRILNWDSYDPNVFGYKRSPDRSNMPIFVTYQKKDEVEASTQYDDQFISRRIIRWFTKNRRNLDSPEIHYLKNPTNKRLPLFVKKSDSEGKHFYYLGDVKPDLDSFKLESIDNKSVVTMNMKLEYEVDLDIYNYLIN
jgi:superfamily II DNA or RNA helicase